MPERMIATSKWLRRCAPSAKDTSPPVSSSRASKLAAISLEEYHPITGYASSARTEGNNDQQNTGGRVTRPNVNHTSDVKCPVHNVKREIKLISPASRSAADPKSTRPEKITGC